MVRRRRRRHRRACRHPKDLLRPLRRAHCPHHQRRVRRPRRHARRASRARGRGGSAAGVVSQLVSPPLMQVVCTPLHLLALNLVNVPAASAAARVAALGASTPAALLARSLRMLPAYGVGGLLNAVVTAKGRTSSPPSSRSVCKRLGHAMGTMSFGAFGRKTSAAGARRRAGRFPGGGVARRALRGRGAGLPDGTDARAAKFANITHATGTSTVPIPTTVQVTEVEDAARGGRGTVAGGWAGAERTVSTKEVVGGGRGGGAEHSRAVGEVGGRARARTPRGDDERRARSGSFDAFVDARRRRPRTSKISRVRVIKHQQNPS